MTHGHAIDGTRILAEMVSDDSLVTLDGKTVQISSVEHELLDTSVKVYNFEVEDRHTYFVGSGYLVHNLCDSDRSIFHEWGKEYKRNGISESDAYALWELAFEYGVPGHAPGYDSYKYGYHMKIYNYHINIY